MPKLPLVLIVSALPPPLHGQSVVTAQVAAEVSQAPVDLQVIDTSPGSLQRSIPYHARKILRMGRGALALASGRRRTSKHLYTTVESRFGIVYNLMLAAVARAFGYRLFLHHHTASYLREYRRAVALLIGLAGPSATHIVLSSRMGADLTRLYKRPFDLVICHNARYISAPKDLNIRSKPCVLGMLGNLTLEKGLALSIAACVAARAAHQPFKLVVAGPIADEAAARALHLGQIALGDALQYRGAIYGEQKADFYRDIDVLLFPSLYKSEAQPLVMLEAMAAGRPVIFHDIAYTAELAGGTGVAVPVNSPFSDTVIKTLMGWRANPQQFQEASRAAQEHFLQLRHCSDIQFSTLIAALAGPGS